MPPIGSGQWLDLQAGLMPSEGMVATMAEGEMNILIANVSGSLLAFRDRCASCESEIAAGELKGGVLACPECERRYYLPRAGRSMDEEKLLLEPVPLLAQDGSVRIAVLGMTGGNGNGDSVSEATRASMISSLRGLTRPDTDRRPAAPATRSASSAALRCRRTIATCSSSPSGASSAPARPAGPQRSGDPELRPTGSRIVWLDDFELPEELWAKLQVPIGLAFFMRSSVAEAIVACTRAPRGPPSPSSTCRVAGARSA